MIHKPRDWTDQEIKKMADIFGYLNLSKEGCEDLKEELVAACIHPADRIRVEGCASCGKVHYLFETGHDDQGYFFICPTSSTRVEISYDYDY